MKRFEIISDILNRNVVLKRHPHIICPTLNGFGVSVFDNHTCFDIGNSKRFCLDFYLVGSGNFTADALTGDKIALELAGSGNVNIAAVTGKSLEGGIAGSGSIRVAGKVERSKYDVAGSGNIDATKLASTDADVSIAGSGDITLMATGKVSADIAGSGDVTVTGGAKCSSSIGGSGKVNCS